MKPLFPPLADPTGLPTRVLCLAPHADDEVFGCGGVLAMHAQRGDAARVIVMTDGAAGDPDSAEGDIVEARKQESRRAGEALGVKDHRFLGLPDGGLAECEDLAERVRREIDEFEPELVYAPSPQEMHPDHRALSRALADALASEDAPRPRCLLYGVNAQVAASVLFDITPYFDKKRDAIRCFESQLRYHDLVTKAEAVDRARTVNVEDPAVEFVEGFADVAPEQLAAHRGVVTGLVDLVLGEAGEGSALPTTTAVISTWNKADVVRENLESLRAQTLPFASIVVVDNASSDGTGEMIASEFPEVRLVRMPHDKYGACETFNIGFSCATTPLVAILDDDITLPPDWLERTTKRMVEEPPTTAIVSTKIVEPGMPESFKSSEAINTERYMSTFRGCGSLARADAIREAGYYDVRLFIYGNERDLTCRLLNRGYRVLQFPEVETYHKTPFGIQMGKRSLFFHARNAWLSMLKYAPLSDLVRMPWLVLTRVLMRGSSSEEQGKVTDATGTIGIGKSLRQTDGALWVLIKASFSILANVPYCLKHREPCKAPDFELPLH